MLIAETKIKTCCYPTVHRVRVYFPCSCFCEHAVQDPACATRLSSANDIRQGHPHVRGGVPMFVIAPQLQAPPTPSGSRLISNSTREMIALGVPPFRSFFSRPCSIFLVTTTSRLDTHPRTGLRQGGALLRDRDPAETDRVESGTAWGFKARGSKTRTHPGRRVHPIPSPSPNIPISASHPIRSSNSLLTQHDMTRSAAPRQQRSIITITIITPNSAHKVMHT